MRIGTRESQLAVWQATLVQDFLKANGQASELVYIKSEGDIDLITPLYAMGVQGVFTKTLDAALLSGRIDIAVHSMKDVPVQLATGIIQAAVLERASYKDILVPRSTISQEDIEYLTRHPNSIAPDEAVHRNLVIGTSSIRRKAQWLHKFPVSDFELLRGNINTRLKKLESSNWHGAIFAAAGLERVGLRPANAINLDWMLPAPAQGAIMVVCRAEDTHIPGICAHFNHEDTALCARLERDFLQTLMGGCSAPISALAAIQGDAVHFKGSILNPDGAGLLYVEKTVSKNDAATLGKQAGETLLQQGAAEIIKKIR